MITKYLVWWMKIDMYICFYTLSFQTCDGSSKVSALYHQSHVHELKSQLEHYVIVTTPLVMSEQGSRLLIWDCIRKENVQRWRIIPFLQLPRDNMVMLMKMCLIFHCVSMGSIPRWYWLFFWIRGDWLPKFKMVRHSHCYLQNIHRYFCSLLYLRMRMLMLCMGSC